VGGIGVSSRGGSVQFWAVVLCVPAVYGSVCGACLAMVRVGLGYG
jgi:hypothetical protein